MKLQIFFILLLLLLIFNVSFSPYIHFFINIFSNHRLHRLLRNKIDPHIIFVTKNIVLLEVKLENSYRLKQQKRRIFNQYAVEEDY